MKPPRTREVNLGQAIIPFGVGGILDLMGESLMACDVSYWPSGGGKITSQRLVDHFAQDGIAITGFRSPTDRLPFVRFPKWLFCPACRRMQKMQWRDEQWGEPPHCQNSACSRRPVLVPMRFVMACTAGHVADVPWDYWAHRDAVNEKQRKCKSKKLVFEHVKNRGTGLASLQVRCLECEARKSLQGISSKGAFSRIGVRCPGTQPWEKPREDHTCEAPADELIAVQRGASNLYYAAITSAIDIPPESDFDPNAEVTRAIRHHAFFDALMAANDGPINAGLKQMLINALQMAGFDAGVEMVNAVLADEQASRSGKLGTPPPDTDLLAGEWNAFLHERKRTVDERSTFITEHVPLISSQREGPASTLLTEAIDRVVLAHRLREVRALRGFSRITTNRVIDARLTHTEIPWLPAIEVFGEGIFFSLPEERVAEWEKSGPVRNRFASLRNRVTAAMSEQFPEVSARFVLLHTLAHVVIRQLSFETGYPMASIGERIYSRQAAKGNEPQSGILVYTTQGDIEGTLGGLVRIGRPPHFADLLVKALARAMWCSSDPVCSESQGQGVEALNLAACHACALLPETSCAHRNLLLDRSLLIDDTIGYFSRVLASAVEQSASAAASGA